jgi:hypothetical protein
MKTLTRSFALLAILMLFATGTMTAQEETNINFNNEKTGDVPENWTNVSGKWVIDQYGTNRVLAQTAQNKGMNFNVIVFDNAMLKDVELSVDILAISGNEDQGGGLVWRYQDEDNYYIVRFNPLESNYRLYKVENGKRIQLASAKASTLEGKWFSVKVVMNGNEIRCSLGEQELLNETDDTFTNAGKTGFWTKADAVSDFDNFKLKGK